MRATGKVKFAASFRDTDIGIYVGLINDTSAETLKNSGIQCCKFLVYKKTLVLRRWEDETWKFGFIKRVDKAFLNVLTVVELWQVVVFYEFVEDPSRWYSLCAQFMLV